MTSKEPVLACIMSGGWAVVSSSRHAHETEVETEDELCLNHLAASFKI